MLKVATEQNQEGTALLIMRAAIQLGANVDNPTNVATGNTALHIAARKGQTFVCQFLMDSGAKLVNNKKNYTPLDFAAIYGKAKVIPIIYKDKLNPTEYERKFYPHHYAAMYGNYEALMALYNIENHTMKQVLHYGASDRMNIFGSRHNVLTLAIKNSNLDLHMVLPCGSIHHDEDHHQTIITLLSLGVPMSGPDVPNAMKAAIVYGSTGAAMILFDNGYKNLNEPCSDNGDTPLHVAAEEDYLYIIQFLLRKGADKTVKNSLNQTPYDVATDDKIKELLLVARQKVLVPKYY